MVFELALHIIMNRVPRVSITRLLLMGNLLSISRACERPLDRQCLRKKYDIPTPPIVASSIIVHPLCCVLSATQVGKMVIRKDRKKGGAVSPCASTALKPMSFMIVGRKTGREENPTYNTEVSFPLLKSSAYVRNQRRAETTQKFIKQVEIGIRKL